MTETNTLRQTFLNRPHWMNLQEWQKGDVEFVIEQIYGMFEFRDKFHGEGFDDEFNGIIRKLSDWLNSEYSTYKEEYGKNREFERFINIISKEIRRMK